MCVPRLAALRVTISDVCAPCRTNPLTHAPYPPDQKNHSSTSTRHQTRLRWPAASVLPETPLVSRMLLTVHRSPKPSDQGQSIGLISESGLTTELRMDRHRTFQASRDRAEVSVCLCHATCPVLGPLSTEGTELRSHGGNRFFTYYCANNRHIDT